MLTTKYARRGAFTAPHYLATQTGIDVLRDGGNAIDAMIAAAATIAVVYPHMNSIGGDSFWIVRRAGELPVAIGGCGAAAENATLAHYREAGLNTIPFRGPWAANTVAGTIGAWHEANVISRQWGSNLPLARLLEDAIDHARHGFPVTASQRDNTVEKLPELQDVSGFAALFTPDGKVPEPGQRFVNRALADTFEQLARTGLMDFYRGDVARSVAAQLARSGSPLSLNDLAGFNAECVRPLQLRLKRGRAYNFPPPTQGLASLIILGIADRLGIADCDEADYVHRMVEAAKQAFIIRDRVVTDPAYAREDIQRYLHETTLDDLATRVDRERALAWPHQAAKGDTIWMGAVDGDGNAVSFIQSIYWEFGSGVVLPESGIHWQNRGASFALDSRALNALTPGRKPFHTLNPALFEFDDHSVMVYGTMGGEGQPQTQSALFTRYALRDVDLQSAISMPRWLLGRTWGASSTSLKLECRFDEALISRLEQAGHDIDVVSDFDPMMGHAGAIVRYPGGMLAAATDPRSDGLATGY